MERFVSSRTALPARLFFRLKEMTPYEDWIFRNEGRVPGMVNVGKIRCTQYVFVYEYLHTHIYYIYFFS